jgi:hypothetical protein
MTRTKTKRALDLVPAPPPPINLDIACGQRKQNGYIGIDRAAIEGVDIVHDLTVYPWPVATGSVQAAYCSHYIEHIPLTEIMVDGRRQDALLAFFDELYRILIPGGQVTIIAPYYASMRCWQDPTHRRAISEATFLYANKGWREMNGLDHYDVRADFDFAYSYILDGSVAARNEEARAFWMRHYQNVINDIQVTLTRREG